MREIKKNTHTHTERETERGEEGEERKREKGKNIAFANDVRMKFVTCAGHFIITFPFDSGISIDRDQIFVRDCSSKGLYFVVNFSIEYYVICFLYFQFYECARHSDVRFIKQF